MIFLLLMAFWVAVNAWLWRTAHRRAGGMRGANGWRIFFAVFFGGMIVYLLLVPIWRMTFGGTEVRSVPPVLASAAYIWHPIVLSLFVLPAVAAWWGLAGVVWMIRSRRRKAGSGGM